MWAWGRSGVHRGVPSSIVQDEPASNAKVGMNTSIHAEPRLFTSHITVVFVDTVSGELRHGPLDAM